MTASPDLGPWLRQQREQRSWTRNEMARRLIKVAQVSGDTAMPAATDVAANIYRWERGTVTPSDRYRLYYCHTLGIPPDRFGDPSWDPAQDVPRVIITISLPEGTDTQLRLASTETVHYHARAPEPADCAYSCGSALPEGDSPFCVWA
ncbi:MAG TPA: helix-turn-helix transcriptional regulator, partial [Streptosporangiaceae bacterium]|nr:helix-turn-helix transcriptional regulator [Streptosporangiaceae bacterium]